MRYYLYQDRPAIKNIYAALPEDTFSLETIEYLDQRTRTKEGSYFLSPRIRISEERDARIDSTIQTLCREDISYVREYANLDDMKEIYKNKFFDKLVRNISNLSFNIDKKAETDANIPRIYNKKGRVNSIEFDTKERDKFLKFGEDYLWLQDENILLNPVIIPNIFDDITVVGYITNPTLSPTVVKTLAMYVE